MTGWAYRMIVVAIVWMALLPASALAQGVDPANQPSAQIRFVYAQAGAPPLDILLNGQRIVAGLPAGQATAYGITSAGPQKITLSAAGSAGALLSEEPVSLQKGHSYTFAIGPDSQGAPTAYVLTDDTGIPSDGQSTLRVVNLLSGEPAITAVINNQRFPQMYALGEASARLPVGRGMRELKVLGNAGNELIQPLSLPMNNGEFYTVFVMGSAGNARALAISYPLTSGELPPAQIWIPLATMGRSQSDSAGAASAPPPAQTLPVTGRGLLDDATVPVWLILDGFLVALIGLCLPWWRRAMRGQRRA